MNNEKKYQVFISSTYEDLKEERDAVIKTILGIEQIPIGMEMFNASDSKQWNIICRTIDISDYYVLIIGLRYGTFFENDISYTEKEFDYAISKGIPVLAFVKDENEPSTPKQRDDDGQKQECLNKFRNKAKQKTVGFWKTKEELCAQLVKSLYSEMKYNPQRGWIRTPTDYENKSVVDEKKLELLLSLINENGDLVLDGGTWDTNPFVHFGDEAPKNPKPGTIWFAPIE